MILTDVSDPIHADSLALFTLNIEILLADVTKPEKSKSRKVWNLEIGPVVWEISGGGALCPPPPPQQDVLLTRPQRGEG